MEINKINKEKFEEYQLSHLRNGGSKAVEYALTELIADSLKNKEYKIYLGGGYDVEGKELQLYDVVCYFSLTDDHYMMVVIDDKNGDSLTLLTCDNTCTLKTLEV